MSATHQVRDTILTDTLTGITQLGSVAWATVAPPLSRGSAPRVPRIIPLEPKDSAPAHGQKLLGERPTTRAIAGTGMTA